MRSYFFVLLSAAALLSGCGGQEPGKAELEKGIKFLEQGRNEKCLRAVKKAVEKLSDSNDLAKAHNCAGIAYCRLVKNEIAELAFEKSMDTDPSFYLPVYNMAVLKFEQGESQAAIELLEKAANMDKKDVAALEYLAFVLKKEGKPDLAKATLEKALARSPRSPSITTALGVLKFEASDSDGSLRDFQAALGYDAQYLPAIYNLAVLYRDSFKDQVQADKYFQDYSVRLAAKPIKASGLALDEAENKTLLSPDKKQEKPAVTEELASTEQPKPVKPAKRAPEPEPKQIARPAPAEPASSRLYEESFSNAIKLEQGERPRLEAAVYQYLRASKFAEEAGDGARADKAMREAIRAAGEDARAQYKVGLYLRDKSLNDQALGHFKLASKLNPAWLDPALALVELYVEVGEPDAAIECLKSLVRASPDNPDALWQLAKLYDEKTKLASQARQCYSNFATRFPSDERAAQALARSKALE